MNAQVRPLSMFISLFSVQVSLLLTLIYFFFAKLLLQKTQSSENVFGPLRDLPPSFVLVLSLALLSLSSAPTQSLHALLNGFTRSPHPCELLL